MNTIFPYRAAFHIHGRLENLIFNMAAISREDFFLISVKSLSLWRIVFEINFSFSENENCDL